MSYLNILNYKEVVTIMNLISIENHENTEFEDINFQFNCFYITSTNTLPHWHNHTEIIYISHGNCSVYINGTLFSCNEGDLVLTPSGSLHSILPEIGSKYYAIVVGDTLFTSMMTDHHCKMTLKPFLLNNKLPPLHISNKHSSYLEIVAMIKSIIEEDTNKNKCYEMIIKAELCRLFTQIIRNFPNQIYSRIEQLGINTQTIKKIIAYISTHYSEKITITDMSKYANMSNQHFCRLFKAYTGKTFIEFLTIYRLEQSNVLLINTDLPITQIPDLTGFCNANYYARIYKNRYGHAPSYTRKNYNN